MLKVKKEDFGQVTEVSEKKLSASLQGALPANCTHYILPLYVTKKMEIGGESFDAIHAPMISVAANGTQIIELRPIGGLNRTHAKASFITRKPRREDYISQYKGFDQTISTLNCVKDCMYKGFSAQGSQKVVRPKFIMGTEGKKVAVYQRAGESIDSQEIFDEKAFTTAENIFVGETTIPLYKEVTAQKLTPAQVDVIYAETLEVMVAEGLVTADQAAAWKE
jgi:hypothetical protein